MRYMKSAGLCLVGLLSVFAFGFAGSASAAQLLFVPEEGASFPVHFAGTGGKSELVQDGGNTILSSAVDALAVILNSSLFVASLKFLNSHNNLVSCQTPGQASGTILLNNLTGHLGLTHPNDLPGVLLLVPAGFSFECFGVIIDVRGSVIGLITKPKILVAKQKELELSFKQTNGIQEHKSFLLWNELLSGVDLESRILGSQATFLLSGQEASANLKILTGSFQIIDE